MFFMPKDGRMWVLELHGWIYDALPKNKEAECFDFGSVHTIIKSTC